MSALPDGDPRHGTTSGYQRHGCRCGLCREYMARYMRAWRRKQRNRLMPGDSRHGTVNGYQNYGCRCEFCSAAQRVTRERANPIIRGVLDAALGLRRAELTGRPTAQATHELRVAVDRYAASQRAVAS